MDTPTESISHILQEEEKQETLVKIFGEQEARKRPACVTVLKTPEEVFSFIRDFSNFRKFWKEDKNWDLQISTIIANKVLVCETTEKSPAQAILAFLFEPDSSGKGTVISLKMVYENLSGRMTDMAQKLVGDDLKTLAAVNLRRLKAYLETGEVPTTDGQPSGKEEVPSENIYH